MSILTMTELDLSGKAVLIRQDLNVPIKDGKVNSPKRIEASIPTTRLALEQGAKVMLMSHLGRPTEGVGEKKFSLEPVANYLSQALGQTVRLIDNYLETSPVLVAGEVVLLENVRFNKGEKSNDAGLAKAYAQLCDVYVMDAFGSAHCAQSSTYGVGEQVSQACAGPLLTSELAALGEALNQPKRPMAAIVGGSKVSTKLTVLDALSGIVDQLIPGGGIANTFIAAASHNVGKSLVEVDLIPQAQRLMAAAKAKGGEIPVPTDVVVGKEFSPDAAAQVKRVEDVTDDDMIFDIGPETAQRFAKLMAKAGTIVWNGPVGVFEFDQFGEGTKALAQAIADSSAFSIAGGGDTLAAVEKYNIEQGVSYISTGGGAFLEFLEGRKLPAVEMLEQRG